MNQMKMLNLFSLKAWVLTSLFVSLLCTDLAAQSFWFGPYLGPAIGTQRWTGYNKRPALGYHVGAFIETYDVENPNNSLFARLGLHQRGSSLRTRYNIIGTGDFFTQNNSFLFNNLVLSVGAKRQVKEGITKSLYYLFAIRGEYNLFTNLDKYQTQPNLYFPVNDFVRKLTMGASLGAGYEFNFGEFYGGFIQATVAPDFFNQYLSPAIPNVINPYNPSGNNVTIQSQAIKNLTFEVTVGMKFLRKVIYE